MASVRLMRGKKKRTTKTLWHSLKFKSSAKMEREGRMLLADTEGSAGSREVWEQGGVEAGPEVWEQGLRCGSRAWGVGAGPEVWEQGLRCGSRAWGVGAGPEVWEQGLRCGSRDWGVVLGVRRIRISNQRRFQQRSDDTLMTLHRKHGEHKWQGSAEKHKVLRIHALSQPSGHAKLGAKCSTPHQPQQQRKRYQKTERGFSLEFDNTLWKFSHTEKQIAK